MDFVNDFKKCNFWYKHNEKHLLMLSYSRKNKHLFEFLGEIGGFSRLWFI